MFLIEYGTGDYINAENISYVDIGEDYICFDLTHDRERYHVSHRLHQAFLNELKYFNKNKCTKLEGNL
tara:strand:- start:4096 stop:4299 length:204 start_codon:yes stop_codon:yes gene_type:complete